jgi:predicted RNase H-like nuclease (RuvC/YqgF family)
MDSNIYTVLITIVTTLGGTSAWRYFEKRSEHKEEDDRYIRNDCQSRIAKLEALLENASKEKDELRALVLHLSTEIAKLQTEVAFLQTQSKKSNL